MLTGFYATKPTIEICAIPSSPAIAEGMDADRAASKPRRPGRRRRRQGLCKVKADVEKTTPDCTDGSADRLGVDAVTAIYAAAAPAGTGPRRRPARSCVHAVLSQLDLPSGLTEGSNSPIHGSNPAGSPGHDWTPALTRTSAPYTSAHGIPDPHADDPDAPHWPPAPALW